MICGRGCIYRDPDGTCQKFTDDEYHSFCVDGPCEYAKETNAGRIRHMSDEELAEEIAWIVIEAFDQVLPEFAWKIDRDSRISGTAKDLLEWLKQEATDEGIPMDYLEAGGTL